MSARIEGIKISIARGEDASFSLKPNGFDFHEGSKITFAVRKRPDDESLLINKEIDATAKDYEGLLWIYIDKEDTLGLEFGQYFYDLWVTEDGHEKPMRTNAPFVVEREVRFLRGF